MEPNYQAFLAVSGALSKLVIISMLLERGLAVIFEHEWFIRLTTREVVDPNNSDKILRENRFPGLKGILAILASYMICNKFNFDVFTVVLANDPNAATGSANTHDPMGVILTSLVVAGGSAAAILIFQGYLNLSKQGRDAAVESKQKTLEAQAAEANARKQRATEPEASK